MASSAKVADNSINVKRRAAAIDGHGIAVVFKEKPAGDTAGTGCPAVAADDGCSVYGCLADRVTSLRSRVSAAAAGRPARRPGAAAGPARRGGTASVIRETCSCDSRVRRPAPGGAGCRAPSCRAYRLMTMSSRPPDIRPDRPGMGADWDVSALSRGNSRPTGPIPVCTFLLIVPLRESPLLRPARSCLS